MSIALKLSDDSMQPEQSQCALNKKGASPNQICIKLYLSSAYSSTITKHKIKTAIIGLNRVSLNDLLDKVSKSLRLSSYSISYNETGDEVFFHCGIYPFKQLILCELTPSKSLWVKVRKNINDAYRLKLDLLEGEEVRNMSINGVRKTNHFVNKASRRNNERIIGDVIAKVYLWRKVSKGVVNSHGQLVRLTLDEAAEYTQIKKKSLIEYQVQLRNGRDLGFDFNKYRNEKVNVLRGFIKSRKRMLSKFNSNARKLFERFARLQEIEVLSAVEKKEDESDSNSDIEYI